MKTTSSTFSNALALGVSGLSIGWLMGLSVSPNVQNTITKVLALVVGIMSILAGISAAKRTQSPNDTASNKGYDPTNTPDKRLDDDPQTKPAKDSSLESTLHVTIEALWPVAGFMLGLMVGSTMGLITRTNSLLGPNPGIQAWYWGLDSAKKVELTNQLLWMTYGLRRAKPIGTPQSDQQQTDGKPSRNVAPASTSNEPSISHETPPTLPYYMEGRMFNALIAGFCKRTESQEGDELRAELRKYIQSRLKDGYLPRAEKRYLETWRNHLETRSNNELQQIRAQLCDTASH